jgi:protease IV
MPRFVKAAALALALVVARRAVAQVSSVIDRERGAPAGLALPVFGAAAAEEPTALGTNPAGVGFVKDLALQYFHEGEATPGADADGVYAANRVGPVGVGFSMEWLRPGAGEGARYRRTRLGLALGDGRSLSAGIAWTWLSSPDAGLEQAEGWDLGLTWRPGRHLSVGAALLGNDARLRGARLPLRYDVGLATRLLGDGLTLSADLLADDAGERFRATHVAAGAFAETRLGVAVGLQLLFPVRDEAGARDDVTGLLSVSWNGPHGGWTGGGTQAGDQTGWFAGVRASSERYRAPPSRSALATVDVEEELRRRRFLFFDVGDPDPYGALVRRLEQARDDGDVGGLVVRIERLSLGAGRIEELRSLLAALRARKPVLAYLAGGGTREYWLATAATAIAAPPGAPLFVNGISTSQLFVRDALGRLGVAVEVVKAGAYKSATEPLVRERWSPEAREALDAVLDDVFQRFVGDVAAARRLPPEKVRALVDEGLFGSEDAKAAGLVDEVLWPDELEGWARRVAGRRLHRSGRYRPDPEREAQRWGRPAIVQVIRLEGVIAGGVTRDPFGGRGGIAGAESVARQLRRAAEDREVKAIVLRIDSPGGDGLASDLVWREVVRARRRGKPVIASMGDVAASGGYLVAAGADAIVAEPSTITGSIGVFAAKPDLSGLLGKLSIRREALARGENAQLLALGKAWTASERRVLEKQIQAFYGVFLDRVAEGRKLTRAEVEALAGGRVWTGRQAFDRRLVDRLGTLADAVALAREKAGLGAGDLVEVRRAGAEGSRLATAAGALAATVPDGPLARVVDAIPELRAVALLLELGPVLALPEAWIDPSATP